ncbi:MAG: flagellar basal body rod protein FlgB [Deltaproteobacteria bacterium]|nr:flagellar basal body rod protein FlgB [Deltaproteobacteria bacterium]
MKFLFDPTIRFLEKAASYRVARQEVVASNLANAETPGYVAKEVPFETFLSRMESGSSIAPVATSPRHIGAVQGAINVPPPVENEGDAARVDGNNVILEKEMTKLAENNVGYLTDLQLVSKKLRMIRYAIDESTRQ